MAISRPASQYDLTRGPIGATLKRMTAPMILGMFMMFTFNLVDTYFISMLGTEPLSAISFTFPVTFTIMSLAVGLSIGTSAVVAKYLGRQEHKKAREASTVTSYLAMAIAAVLAALGMIFMDPIFALLGASDALMPLIHAYMDIWLPTSVLLVAIISANAILRACGNTRTPSMLMAAAGLINATLDPVFIFGLGPVPAMGIAGAAVATFISWVIGFVYLAWVLTRRLNLIDLALPSAAVFRSSGGEMLRIGIPASGANMLTPLAAGVMTALIAGYGDTAVAAFGVGSRIESIASLLILSLSMTLPPFVSQNYGANRLRRVEEAYRLSIRFVLLFQLAIYGLLVAAMPWIVGLFTDDEAVASVLRLYIWILPLGYGLQGIIILSNSALNALHQPMVALYLSIARFFVFYVPLAWLGSQLYGLPGFFGGAFAGNLLMAAVARLTFRRVVDEACRNCPDELAEDPVAAEPPRSS